MLSAVIRSRHSYGAVHLVVQPPDQRSVHFGPLVLETNLLKNQRLQQIKTNLSHACFHVFLRASDYIFVFSFEFRRLTCSLYGCLRTSVRSQVNLLGSSLRILAEWPTGPGWRCTLGASERISSSQGMLTPHRSLSQPATSFSHSKLSSLKFTNFPRYCPS